MKWNANSLDHSLNLVCAAPFQGWKLLHNVHLYIYIYIYIHIYIYIYIYTHIHTHIYTHMSVCVCVCVCVCKYILYSFFMYVLVHAHLCLYIYIYIYIYIFHVCERERDHLGSNERKIEEKNENRKQSCKPLDKSERTDSNEDIYLGISSFAPLWYLHMSVQYFISDSSPPHTHTPSDTFFFKDMNHPLTKVHVNRTTSQEYCWVIKSFYWRKCKFHLIYLTNRNLLQTENAE